MAAWQEDSTLSYTKCNLLCSLTYYYQFCAFQMGSPQNLKYTRKFAEEYTHDEIGQQTVDQIPWGHIVLLMYSGLDKEQINFYVNQTVKNGLSRNVLSMQIETKLCKRKGAAVTNFEKKLPLPQSDLTQSTIKNPYLFDFLTLGDKAQEREVEKRSNVL